MVAADAKRIAHLYGMLYLEKYSALNPAFSARWVMETARAGLVHYRCARDADGIIQAVSGSLRRRRRTHPPVVGYDTAKPRSLGLYRIACLLFTEDAVAAGVRLNGSAGAASFKRARGAQAETEYSAYYVAAPNVRPEVDTDAALGPAQQPRRSLHEEAPAVSDPWPIAIARGWRPVAYERELRPGRPLRVGLMDQPIALFRTSAGPAALIDRCPHRNVPLSGGRVCGDALVCPYHGWSFDASGRCVAVPGVRGKPERQPRASLSLANTGYSGRIWLTTRCPFPTFRQRSGTPPWTDSGGRSPRARRAL